MEKRTGRSFFGKLFIAFVIFILVPLLLLYLASVWISYSANRETMTRFSAEKASLLADRIDSHIGALERSIDAIYYQRPLAELLIGHNRKAEVESLDYYKLKLELEDVFHAVGEVEALIYLDTRGSYIAVGANLRERDALVESLRGEMADAGGRLVWKHKELSGENKVVMGRKYRIIDDNGSMIDLGYILFLMDETKLYSDYEQVLPEDGSADVYLVDGDSHVVSASDRAVVGLLMEEVPGNEAGGNLFDKNGELYTRMEAPLKTTGWRLVYDLKDQTVRRSVTRMFLLLGMIAAVCLAGAIVVSYLFSRNIANELVGLLRGMDKLQEGNFTVRIRTKKRDEIGLLYDRFNLMAENLGETVEKNISLAVRVKDMQILSYESQINPHFLYNTLEMIGMMAALGENEQIEEAVVYLSEVLRFNLRAQNVVAVGDELSNIENYLRILKLRFRDSFFWSIHVDDDVRSFKTVKFLLQPVVENCVKHGFSGMIETGVIKIAVKRMDGDIVFVIRDNGVGMDEDAVERLRLSLDDESADNRKNIGLRNVHQRIRLTYGGEYGLDVRSQPGKGTHIFIRIPEVREGGEE